MSTEQTQQPAQPQDKQPKYFMIIVKDEGYTCPEERDVLTNELTQPEEYLPPAANPEQWWNENSDFCGLCGGNTIEGILQVPPEYAKYHITGGAGYVPVYRPDCSLTDEEQKSIEESSTNVL